MDLILKITSKLPSLPLVVLCFSFINTFVSGQSVSCVVHNCGCLCNGLNGTFEISMKSLKKFNVQDTSDPWQYDIDPCHEFSELKNCQGVTMCQKSNSKPTESYPVAKSSITSCGSYEEGKPLIVTYKEYLFETKIRQMVISLVYHGSTRDKSNVKQSTSSKDVLLYTLTITDPSLKPQQPSSGGSSSSGGGLSAGSVMVIIFFVVLVIYLVAGILFMKYKRGATGKEVIPNVEFWSSLPGLIKDGCVFFGKNMKVLCGRCCQREGYSEI